MVDIEKLENLPKRENRAVYLKRITGGMWNSKLDYRRTKPEFYILARRILEHYVGESFNEAFTYFLSLTKNKHHNIFLEKVNKNVRCHYYKSYYIDENYTLYRVPKKKYRPKLQITDIDTGIVYEYTCKNYIYYRDLAINASKSKKLQREAKKIKQEKVYSFVSDKEIKLKAEKLLDKQKLYSHGFDDESFKGAYYRRKKEKKWINTHLKEN